MADDISCEHEANADIIVDDIVKKEVSSTEVDKLVFIEEMSDEDIPSVEAANYFQEAYEHANYADKLEIVHGSLTEEANRDFVAANENITLHIPIHIIDQDTQSPVEDIQSNELIESQKLPTITTTESLAQTRVSYFYFLEFITVNTNHQTTAERKAMAVTFVNEKFPAHGVTRISERIIMYRHDYNSSNILQVI